MCVFGLTICALTDCININLFLIQINDSTFEFNLKIIIENVEIVLWIESDPNV